MKEWNLAPDLDDQAFEFTPPADARKIDFVPLGEGGTLSQ